MLRYLTLFLFTIIFPAISHATIIFEDNFDDGDTVGWQFNGINLGPWSATSGEMQSASTQTAHVPVSSGGPGAALISGIVTPDHFSLEADIRVIGDVPGQTPGDFGHVGLVWGWSDSSNYNTSYLRTHSDHVTSFGTPGGAENILSVPGAVNDVVYHMTVEVDVNAQVMSLTIGAQSTTFTGADFLEINVNSGGSIGLITWGERVGYDNVVLKDLATYTVGGSISGLIGSVTLQNNGGDDLTASADGSFTFGTALANGAAYAVTVSTQPTGQTCSVTDGSGTIATADINNVSVTCVDDVAPPAPVVPIPTMSQWALILFSTLLGLMVFVNRRRLF